jgi:uncharacterized protein (DUF2235 family)
MSKRIVICADGTWNAPEQMQAGRSSASNVVRVASSVQPLDARGMPQVVYYHKGVGARGGLWDRLSGGAFGAGISRNIEDLYLFLITNYAPGDELFLFGFSRGAYAVRSLAGLIRNCGLLRPQFMDKYLQAYALYRDRSAETRPDAPAAGEFRARYAWPDFPIRFMGVWDTVGALGIPVTPLRFWTKRYYEFHDVDLSSHVQRAYQALAIDERRPSFTPAIWRQQPHAVEQILEQAWFPGVHSDIGGAYGKRGLADCSLGWMWSRAVQCGLALEDERMPKGDPLAPMGNSMTPGYRLLGERRRVLGEGGMAAQEGVHRCVLERLKGSAAYRPANLVDYCTGAHRVYDDPAVSPKQL